MSESPAIPALMARGLELDLSETAFGFLRSSSAIAGDGAALRQRMEEDGYLFLPGLLPREEVAAARLAVLERAAEEGLLDPEKPREQGVLKEGINPYFRPQWTRDNPAIHRILYGEVMLGCLELLLEGEVRHFDYTWLRAVGPGKGTSPHCDIVYMGRGTRRLFTAWTPLGDISLPVGGLILLEGSHKRTDITGEYLDQDVDSYCENGPNAEAVRSGKLRWEHWQKWREPGADWDGALSQDPVALRAELGGRWLTASEYRMGDVLLFCMGMIHASIDNTTRLLRLSTDSRYQRADEPVDERWVSGPKGEFPYSHGPEAKRGKIC